MNAMEISEHMKVVGSDGDLVGIVDSVEGNHIKLTKDGPGADGNHHYLPVDQVEAVEDGEVRLLITAEDAMAAWTSLPVPDTSAAF